MKKNHLFTQIYFLLFTLIFITSCNSQNKSTSSENSPNNFSKGLDSIQLSAPRVDSILEFNSMITVIFEDSKGNFWFGSHCDGVCRYDGKQFTYFTANQGLPSAKVHFFDNKYVTMGNSIRYIEEDENGHIWFGTGDGISKFDGKSFTTIYPEKESILITESFEYSENTLAEDWEKELNNLWFGVAEKAGLYRYDGQKLTHLTYPIPESKSKIRWSTYATYSLYKDKDGNLWFGTEGGGIMKYNGISFTCINEKEEKGIVRAFFQDNTGKVWIANNTLGLCYYDGESLKNFTEEQGLYSFRFVRNNVLDGDFETLDGVQSINQGKNGDLWFGTFGDGLWRYDGEKLTHFTEENGLPSDTVKSIYKDKTGELWFGIGRGTVYSFDGILLERFDGKVLTDFTEKGRY